MNSTYPIIIGNESSDKGISTPDEAIPFKQAATLLVNVVFPVYKIAELLFLT